MSLVPYFDDMAVQASLSGSAVRGPVRMGGGARTVACSVECRAAARPCSAWRRAGGLHMLGERLALHPSHPLSSPYLPPQDGSLRFLSGIQSILSGLPGRLGQLGPGVQRTLDKVRCRC